MHIKETDEHLDYDAFYTFPPNETNITQAAGRRTWNLLHGLADHYPCAPCKAPFQTLVSGLHDVVNIHLGKGIYDHPNWEKFLKMVDEARSQNPHSEHFRHERKEDPTHFDPLSFRTVTHGDHRIVVGCPVGEFSGGRCKVGTREQAILHPIHERRHG